MKFVTPYSMILIVTVGCNSKCSHCCLASSPDKLGIRLTEDEMMTYIRQANRFGVQNVVFTGGEPMLFSSDLVKPMLLAKGFGMYVDIRTNAYWAQDYEHTTKVVRELKENGMNRLGLSYDRFHAEKIAVDCIQNAVRSCEEQGIATFLDWIGSEQRDSVLEFLGVRESVVRFVGSPMNAGRATNNGFTKTPIDALECEYVNNCDDVSGLLTVFPQEYASYHPCCWVNPDLVRKVDSSDSNWIGKLFSDMQCSSMVNFLGEYGVSGLIRKARRECPQLLESDYVHECDVCYDLLGELFKEECVELPTFINDFRGLRSHQSVIV